MRRNGLRILAVAMAAATLAVVSAPRDAEAVSLNLINNWRMGNLGTLGNTNGTGSVATNTGGFTGGIGAANWVPDIGVNIHFGIGLGKGDQVVPFLGFNVDRVGIQEEDEYDWDPDSDGTEYQTGDRSMMVFGLEIGGKFFFIERAKGKAPPFLYVSFFKYFGDLNAQDARGHLYGEDYADLTAGVQEGDDEDGGGTLIGYDNARHSPLGFNLGFGAEYYFNDNFALGATFLGVSLSYASATYDYSGYYRNTAVTEFNLYTNLSMTYRFAFSVRASVQFESDYDYED